MHDLNSVSLAHLRKLASDCDRPVRVRFYHRGFVVFDRNRNSPLAGPLDEVQLRRWLLMHLQEGDA